MFWNSVVFKLWYTIILFFSVVLFILTMLLLEFFQSFHLNNAEEQLTKLAEKIAVVMEAYDDHHMALATAWEIVDASSARFVIIASPNQYWYSPNPEDIEDLPIELFLENEELSKVLTKKEKVVVKGYFPDDEQNQSKDEVIIVGVPLSLQSNPNGGVFLYQSLDIVQNTMDQVKKIIYISAGIAIILTTVFAFFLSTRINAPLRKMKEAATNAAKGMFNTNIPIVTRDEIGELAKAFNKMAKEIQDNIEALNQEKEQLASVLSSMADGVITINRNGQIVQTNPPAERFLQAWYYEQGMNLDNHEEIPNEMKNLFEKVVSLEKEQLAEISIQGRTWVVVMTPLYSQDYVRGAVAVLRDMTEERRMDKLREDFIANVSHELRTPISLLQGYSEAIVDNVAGSIEEMRELGQIIYDESLRMGRLVNELLDLAKLETGNIQLEKTEVEIMTFTERVTRKFQAMAKEQQITLSFEKSEDKVFMAIDTDRIEQVLTNLIDNALRHTSENGKVTVRVNVLSKGVKFEVQDTGSGIPEEDLPFVFERFYKADKARTRGRSGTGLGLAIAKNIVESHGGEIYVHSIVNKGTTFSFFLPF